ncbi:MAG TPA: ABC transporter ATP-binding protein [Candidatus Avoscillospira stercorigallinarum]|uniref:ABC transporter ATP-binding protein n=1 Tax=Candidatus Avoscillospira stercorigallinarum TaxID=2840708 RepID=A0A9D1CND0_9FIRM|nr:ABC transporter ATP-binding protein [Candidatus Avoscillospira stercorigallinarum]
MKQKDFQNWSVMRIFLSYFGPHKKLFILDMCCAFLVAVVDLIYPLVSRSAMYDMLPNNAYRTFFVVMLIVVLAYVVRSLMHFVITYWGHTFGIRVEADIRQDLFEHLQTLGFDFFDRNRTGQLMSRLTSDLFEITELAHHGPEDLFISLATIVGALIVMFTIEWRLALVVSILIPIFILVVISRRQKLGEVSRQVKAKVAVITTEIESSLSGIRTAKAFANEDVELRKFSEANGRFRTSKRRFHREMGIFTAVMEFFLSIMSVAVIAVGGFLIMNGQLNYIDLITFSLYISAFISPIRKLASFAEQYAVGLAGLQRFTQLMRTEPDLRDAPDAKTLSDVRGEIVADHLDFAYDGDLDVLHDVNLHVTPGETIAIVGPSGGGKTTLCQLIPRFYDVTHGSLSIDGLDVRAVTQHSLREHIGIVQQDVFLFADSILENIRYGKPSATMAEIEEAARRAEIYDDIMAMPDGFHTYVGERGTLLSGGQKQRIAIARIFLKNPPILILDEATSALDTITEAKIQSAFDALAKGRTTLIIAHRLSTIRNATRILVIENGRIQEQGTHAQLMALNGVYANLYTTQTKLRT